MSHLTISIPPGVDHVTILAPAPSGMPHRPVDASGAGLVFPAAYLYAVQIGPLVHVTFEVQYPVTMDTRRPAITLPVAAKAGKPSEYGGVGSCDAVRDPNGFAVRTNITAGAAVALLEFVNSDGLTNALLSGRMVRGAATYIAD